MTALRDHWVLVNRTADGRLQTYDNLVFHGGPGSTLEMRVFNESTLRGLLKGAGFESIRIAGEACAEFGIVPDDPWSLPIAARKGTGVSSAFKELASEYAEAKTKLRVTKVDLKGRSADYQRHVEWAEQKIAELERESAARFAWGQGIEQTAEGQVAHLQGAMGETEGALASLSVQFDERTEWALRLQKEVESLTARVELLERNRWVKLGRRLRLLP